MIAYLDCASGVSGDKFLGALLDAGLDLETLLASLGTLDLTGWAIRTEEVHRAGFRGLHVRVEVDGDQPYRDHSELRHLIETAMLPPTVRERALDTFGHLARAEAHAHGITADEVHFHEVGAVDSIIDVVGTVVGLDALGIERLFCSPLALGGGTVLSTHGILSVPAPATALLLEGIPSYGGPVDDELTTPTGAALVRALADDFGRMPAMVPRVVGFGAGTRDLELPNLLRLVLGDPAEVAGDETVVSLRSVIDHRTPEELATALDALRADGALDVWQTPVVMKKGRAAVEVNVLARPLDAARLTEALMRETGTLGVRREFVDRTVAERATIVLETSLGSARFKVGFAGGLRSVRPEHDDVVRLAAEHDMTAREVAERLSSEADEALGD